MHSSIICDIQAALGHCGRPRRTLKLALACGEESVQAFNGKRESLVIQVGEKATQNYRIEAAHPGGHSSRPVAGNAIYELAEALERVRAYRFPVRLNDTTRIFLAAYAQQTGGVKGDLNRVLRTTCVATLLDGGHASNALPSAPAPT